MMTSMVKENIETVNSSFSYRTQHKLENPTKTYMNPK